MDPRLLLRLAIFTLTGFSFSQREVNPETRVSPTAAPRGHLELPFKLYTNHVIVVRGSLGELGQLNFLIDTGANPSAVDRRIAKKLGLTGEVGKLGLFNQNVEVERVVLPSLQLGPIRTESLPGLIQDLYPVEQVIGVRIDAIIGFGVLSLSSFVIDYNSKKIIFGPVEPSTLAVAFESGPPTITLKVFVQNQPLRLLIDTGAADLVLFECQLHGRLRELLAHGVKRSSNSAESQFELKEVWPRVRLGVTDFGSQRAFLAGDNVNCGRSFDGVLGATSLGLKRIAFDFERRSFSWEN